MHRKLLPMVLSLVHQGHIILIVQVVCHFIAA
jgi:hypothetical protein